MTAEQRKQVADRVYAEHIYAEDYIRGSIGLMAVLPVLYGLATWWFGDDLWSGSEVYKTALSVPGAPQSWGSVFITVGLTLLICAVRRNHTAVMVVTVTAALVMSMFMVSFTTEFVVSGNESAIPPAIAWLVFSLLFLNLSRLALKMRTMPRDYPVDLDVASDEPPLRDD